MKRYSSGFTKAFKYSGNNEKLRADYFVKRMNIILPYLRKGQKILELGCGEGLLGKRIKAETGGEVYGVDISESGVRAARKKGIRARVSDLNNRLPYPDYTFNLIVSDQVIEHVYRTDHLMDEIYRILKPDGIVITITPNLSFWLNRILFIIGIYPLFLEAGESSKGYGTRFLKKYIQDKESVGHIHVFNKHALADIFYAHGFIVKKITGSSLSWSLPPFFRTIYNIIDNFFALFPSLARDCVVIAVKYS